MHKMLDILLRNSSFDASFMTISCDKECVSQTRIITRYTYEKCRTRKM